MKFVFKHLFLLLCFFPLISFAVQSWKIDEGKSSLTFTATQNNAPVKGGFKRFSGDIQFDPKQLAQSKVKIYVDMGSLQTAFEDLTATLVTNDWFSSKAFPQAVFESKGFKGIGGDHYQANGTLKIKKNTQPVTLTFTFNEMNGNQADVQGSVKLKRLAFDVGQGEWSSTDEIKDEVRVDFKVVANKMP